MKEGRIKLLAIVIQLGLVLLVMHQFGIEENSLFLRLTPLIFAGFIVHSLLPLRLRLPFFLLLSLAGIGIILGYPSAVMLVGLGLILITICHLPIPFAIRVVLLFTAVLGLVALRAEWVVTRWGVLPTLVLPILGSMFMFRLILYLYDLRTGKHRTTIWMRLAYFFMLPNVCFLLFPVVDYQTLCRTYYDTEAYQIYQKGVSWIFRGVTHLLIYRVVYYYLLPSVSDVVDLGSAIQYMLATYLLYLRISGLFHVIVGIICLFGFNLPETHHLFFLATSFTDYWRRINIYWKDFMMKIFYYPSLNRLRRYGLTLGMAGSTLIVFIGTWLLHSYQWFWLRGTFPLTMPDVFFWGILGLLVVVNVLYEAKWGRKRTLSKRRFSWGEAFTYSLRVVGMFVFITILWTLWSSQTMGEFIAVMRASSSAGVDEWLALLLFGIVLLAGGVLIQFFTSRGMKLSMIGESRSFRKSMIYTSLGTVMLLLVGMPQVHRRIGDSTSGFVASLQKEGLNQQDMERQVMGYYEGLLNKDQFTAALWRLNRPVPPDDWGVLDGSDLVRQTSDILRYELRPFADGALCRAPFKVNRWGMRDMDYEKEKPTRTYRIAMLGASYVVGAGVEQEQTFEARLESRLNQEQSGSLYDRYEILNFGVGGYDPVRTSVDVKKRVHSFEPDMALYIVHASDVTRMQANLVQAVEAGVTFEHQFLQDIVDRSGVKAGMESAEAYRKLEPYLVDLMEWSYRNMAEDLRGTILVAFLLPRTMEAAGLQNPNWVRRTLHLLQEAGFWTFNLEGIYENYDIPSLWLAPWDEHPNVLGHQLIANRLHQVLLENNHLPGLSLN